MHGNTGLYGYKPVWNQYGNTDIFQYLQRDYLFIFYEIIYLYSMRLLFLRTVICPNILVCRGRYSEKNLVFEYGSSPV